MVLVVIDINGVLGEVTKKKIESRETADAILPSGQRFYLNPYSKWFLDTLMDNLGASSLILWTSRLRKNARPIEQIAPMCYTHFVTMLHGEDCVQNKDVGYHPVKQVSVLRDRLPPWLKDETIIFVDDSPKYVETDIKSFVLGCESYSAKDDNHWNLEEIISRFHQLSQ